MNTGRISDLRPALRFPSKMGEGRFFSVPASPAGLPASIVLPSAFQARLGAVCRVQHAESGSGTFPRPGKLRARESAQAAVCGSLYVLSGMAYELGAGGKTCLWELLPFPPAGRHCLLSRFFYGISVRARFHFLFHTCGRFYLRLKNGGGFYRGKAPAARFLHGPGRSNSRHSASGFPRA